MEWEEREEYRLAAVGGLFVGLRQLYQDLPNLKDLAFPCCLDIYNEMAHALVRAGRKGDQFDIKKMWDRLEREADLKVNGAGFPNSTRTL